MRTWAAAICVAMCGCMSVAELRETEPVHVDSLRGDYALVAECIAAQIDAQEGMPPVLRIDRPARVGHVFRTVSSTAVYDIEVRQAGEQVAVIGRGMSTIHGRAWHVDVVWPAVGRCHGQNSPGAVVGS